MIILRAKSKKTLKILNFIEKILKLESDRNENK